MFSKHIESNVLERAQKMQHDAALFIGEEAANELKGYLIDLADEINELETDKRFCLEALEREA